MYVENNAYNALNISIKFKFFYLHKTGLGYKFAKICRKYVKYVDCLKRIRKQYCVASIYKIRLY